MENETGKLTQLILSQIKKKEGKKDQKLVNIFIQNFTHMFRSPFNYTFESKK